MDKIDYKGEVILREDYRNLKGDILGEAVASSSQKVAGWAKDNNKGKEVLYLILVEGSNPMGGNALTVIKDAGQALLKPYLKAMALVKADTGASFASKVFGFTAKVRTKNFDNEEDAMEWLLYQSRT